MSSELLTGILGFLGGVFSVSGVGYAVVQHWLNRDKNKVEVKQQEVATHKDILGNGFSMMDIYKEIDVIVASKTKPLEDKIDYLSGQLQKYGCFRSPCKIRLTDESYAQENNEGNTEQ